ncbi:MAG: FlgD immunoglobulin-like domain containing protein [FCB group bacterium]
MLNIFEKGCYLPGKKIIFNISPLSLLIIILISFQHLYCKEAPKANFQELRDNIKDYVTTNIIPDLKIWKAKLDGAMSKEDLQQLNELRSKAASQKEQMLSERKNMMEKRKNGEEITKEALQEKMKANRTSFQELAQQVKPLAEKYQATLEEIGELAKPRKEEWGAKLKEIHQNWQEKNKPTSLKTDRSENELNNNQSKVDGDNMHQGFGQLRNMEPDFSKKMFVSRFMLWDGSDNLLDQGPPLSGPPQLEMLQNTGMNVTISPNPFKEDVTIRFSLTKMDDVSLVIEDSQGEKVALLFSGKLGVGEHSFVFDVTDPKELNLVNGTYFYQLKTSTGTKSGKMLLNR